MLLLSSVFRPRWPRSLSSGPPPDDILLRRQRTPVAQTRSGPVSLTLCWELEVLYYTDFQIFIYHPGQQSLVLALLYWMVWKF